MAKTSAYRTETSQVSAQYINHNFVRKLDEGRTKEAEAEGSAFIRQRLRQESFFREIIEPVMLSDDEIDRDENTDQPKKIVEKEPDSIATFVPRHVLTLGAPPARAVRPGSAASASRSTSARPSRSTSARTSSS